MKKKTTIIILLVTIIILGCAHTNKRPKPEFTRLGFGYSMKKGEIYFTQRSYIPGGLSSTIYFPEPINVHSRSFKVLEDYFAEDKNQIYYCAKIIENVDKETFQILKVLELIPCFTKLYPNSKQEYSTRLKEQYVITKTDYYAKDKNFVYYGENVINEAQPGSFRLFSILYSKDENNVYYKKHKIEGADVVSFEIVAGNLAKDKNYVYYSGNSIAENDEFQLVNEHYFCNKNNVFYSYSLLSFHIVAVDTLYKLNPDEFEVIGNNYALDTKYVYFRNGLIENADINSFCVLSQVYSKDNNNIYYGSQIVEGVDIETFEVFKNGNTGKDKYHTIMGGKVLK